MVNSVSGAADIQYTYVILSTKCVPDVIKTPELLNPLLSPPYCDKFDQPTYVLLQNGLNIELDLYRAVKALRKTREPRIINTSIYVLTNLIAPNVVEHEPFVGADVLNVSPPFVGIDIINDSFSLICCHHFSRHGWI